MKLEIYKIIGGEVVKIIDDIMAIKIFKRSIFGSELAYIKHYKSRYQIQSITTMKLKPFEMYRITNEKESSK